MENQTNKLDLIQNKNIYSLNQIIDENSKIDEAKIIAKATKNQIEQYGSKVTHDNFKQLTIAAQVLLSRIKLIDKIVILPLECGFGKTTLIQEFLKYMLKHYHDFGAIIVKERIEDAIKLEQQLGGQAIAVFSFCQGKCKRGLKKYNRFECINCTDYCDIKETPQKQINYPIAIISSERYRIMMLYKKDLGDFIYYKDKNGGRRKRVIVIIDEKPTLSVNKPLDTKKLEEIKHVFENVDESWPIYEEANNFLNYISEIDRTLRESTKRDIVIKPFNSKFEISTAMKLYFEEYYAGDHVENLEFIYSVIKKGGVIRKGNKKANIQNEIYTIDYVKFDNRIKHIILDGTAVFDSEYKPEQFAILDIPRLRDYKYLGIHNCQEINVSRSAMSSKIKNINISTLVEDFSWMRNHKVLFLTYLFKENEVRSKLNGSQLNNNNNVLIDHFGNLKGKNDYSDSDIMIMLGINRKSDAYYLAKAISMGIKIDCFESVSSIHGRKSKNSYINRLLYSDLFCDITQNIFRTMVRRAKGQNVKIYTIIRDRPLVDMLTEYFSNSKILKWYPMQLCKQYMENDTKHDKAIINLNQYLEMKFSDEISGKKAVVVEKQVIRRDLGYVNPKTLQNHLQHELIKETLEKYRVGVYRKTLRKIC